MTREQPGWTLPGRSGGRVLAADRCSECASYSAATTDDSRPQRAVVTPVYGQPCSEHGPRTLAVAVVTVGTERRCLCRDCLCRLLQALQDAER